MNKFALLLTKELKDIFSSKAGILFLLLECLIAGYSFYSAVILYSNASAAALNNPLYAAGFEPVPGVFVPTWGGLYILYSLFLPFVIIPLIVMERARNTLTLLFQIPFGPGEILVSKIAAGFSYLFFSLLLMVPAVCTWCALGGHIAWSELLLLNTGYLLYGLFIIGVSIFSGSLFRNVASASILSILLITLSWVIDFGKDMNISPLVLHMSEWTTTRMLKFFEHGILSSTGILYFIIISLAFLFLSRSLVDVRLNVGWMVGSLVLLVAGMVLVRTTAINIDVTESHRNSFSPAITSKLKKVPPLEIDVYLRRTDSRFKDYQDSFLKKLLLVKRDVTIRLMKGKSLDKNYGLFIYRVDGKEARTYSNSEEEIFPLIFKLAGIHNFQESSSRHFKGYPLVVKGNRLSLILYTYYLVLPFTIISVALLKRFFGKRRLEL